MSPQTAHNCDGENVAELWDGCVDALLGAVGSFLIMTPMRLIAESLLLLLLLLTMEVLLLLLVVIFRQLGELEAELGVLGIVLYSRLNLGLSLLEMDSER